MVERTGGSVVQVPMLTTTASGPVSVGAPISDTAVLSGGAAPTGSITFQLYGPADPNCMGNVAFTSTVSVSGDGTYRSGVDTPTHPGLYEWVASYRGDANNVPVPGACPAAGQSSVVLVSVPTLVATSPASSPTGSPLTDTVLLAGGDQPTGTLTFTLYGPQANCTGTPAVVFPPVAVTGNGTYRSGAFTPTTPGTFQFQVDYSGDPNNLALHIPCGITSQVSVVSSATLAIKGVQPEPTSLGSDIVGRDVIAGGNHPTGSIIFRIYGPNDPTCTGNPIFSSQPIAVTGNGTYVSPPFLPTAPGTYDIVADYSGDANNAPTTASCGAPGETISVSRAILTIVAKTAPQGFVGQALSTAETISGGFRPGGTIVFSFYGIADTTCTHQPLLASAPEPVTGDGTYQSPVFTPDAAGTFRFIVTYSGDSRNIPLTTDCNGVNQAVLVSVSSLYDPVQHPKQVISLEVVAFALLSLAGPAAGTTRSRQSSASRRAASTRPTKGSSSSVGEGSVVSTGVDNTSEGWEAVAVLSEKELKELGKNTGDLSRTWKWPGTERLDKLSLKVPEKLAPASPLGARITNDAGYLRAMFGSASALVPLAGVVLAAIGLVQVHGQAVPPPLLIAVALAVIGVFDAFAGFVAVSVFVVGVIAAGGVATGNDARTLLGLSTLWFAAPIIAGVARPLRRAPTRSSAEHAERIADVVVVALAGAWAVKEILEGLPGLSGKALSIATHADVAAVFVLAALAARMALETAAAHHYPARLSEVQAEELPVSGKSQHLAAASFAVAVFVFVAVPYVGLCWELYVGGVFFVVPVLLKIFSDKLPNFEKLYAVLPRGILQTVTMLVIGTAFGALVAAQITGDNHLLVIRESFLLLSLPGLAVALLQVFGRDGPEAPKIHWVPEKIIGAALVTLAAFIAIGTLKF